jgi:uncharacterized repeat protein (TIGR01451 family)
LKLARSRRALTRRAFSLVAAISTIVALLAASAAAPANAASGDFSIDFAAAAPETYDHQTGGGAFDDRTVGVADDIVESLEGGDFACGDIVTYLTQVVVDDVKSADDDAPQTIEMDLVFLADTTGQSGVALGDIVNVGVNYGAVQAGDGTGGTDLGISDDGGSTATLISESVTGPLFQSGSELLGTVELTDLERAETVVVRIDVKLFCDPGSNPTGNLQAQLDDSRLVATGAGPVDPPQAVPGGAQTIPFKQIGNIGTPDISIDKTVTAAGGTCPGDETLTIEAGDQVTYCYEVSNPGDAPLYNVTVVDDNGTPGDSGDDFAVSLTGLIDVDDDGDASDLDAEAIANGQVTFAPSPDGALPATVTNTAAATGDDSNIDPTQLSDSDTASVVIESSPVVAPIAVVIKGIEAGNDTIATLTEPGGEVTIPVTVTNTAPADAGDATLTELVDNIYGDITTVAGDITNTTCATGGIISGGGTYTCQFVVDVTSRPDTITDTITATLTNDAGDDTDTDQANVIVEDAPSSIEVTKTADPVTVPESGGDVTFTVVVKNTSAVDTVTIDTIEDNQFGDITADCDTNLPTDLAPGETLTCEFTETLSGNPGTTHTNVVTATGTDDDNNAVENDDDAEVGFDDVLPDITVIKTADPTTVVEPGENVTFAFEVTNNGAEAVTLTTLKDDVLLDLDGQGDCVTGGVIEPAETYTCSVTVFLEANAADGTHTNVVTAVGSDDDGNDHTSTDDAEVEIDNADPVITVDKTASQSQVFAPGEDVTFTVIIENDSVASDPVTIDSLLDTVHGDLNGQGNCAVPQMIKPDESYTCEFTANVFRDETNVITANGTDDEGTPVTGEDDATVDVVDPSLNIKKATNGIDSDDAPGDEILVGSDITWSYVVTNSGDVDIDDISVVDDKGVEVTCPFDSLAPGESSTCTGTGTAVAGGYRNVGKVTGSSTDADGDTAPISDTDPSNYFGAAPSVGIVKVFTDDEVTAGAGSSFTIVVTNDGNVDLSDLSVTDSVTDELGVSGITASAGADADSDGNAQTIEWLIADLAVDESVTITVDITVAANAAEAVDLLNMATTSSSYTDAAGTSTIVDDSDDDTVDIVTDIDLSIEKTFDPTTVQQGSSQSFTIVVSNAGPSDAVGVAINDVVDGSLDVQTVSIGSGDCGATADQTVDCVADIPAGESVTVTVEYVAAPFNSGEPEYDTVDGAEFRFVFVNGSVLEGSASGEVYLDGTLVDTANGRNDYVFDPPGPDAPFTLHLSCSDAFSGGWGQSGGPVEGVDTNWQIAFFSITRYKRGDFFRSCGDVVNAFDVPNTAVATGSDSTGDERVSDDATVTVGPGISIDRIRATGKRLTVHVTNNTGSVKPIDRIDVSWPASNGNLRKVTVRGGTVWQGSLAPDTAALDNAVAGWRGQSLANGDDILRFDFKNRSAGSPYAIRVTFDDGTYVDIGAD